MDSDDRIVVIGGGTAGSACARTLAAAGRSVTLVESDKLGGTCIWRGCMPKKALYHAAREWLESGAADQYGVECGARELDWESVLAWKWHSQETYAGDQEGSLRKRGIEVLHGQARFVAPLTVAVDGTPLQPGQVVIATGSESVRPPLPGAERADVSDDALHYRRPPESLVIVGGGYIAFEFAAIYAAFGTRVTMFERGLRPLKAADPDIVDVAVRRLSELGVTIMAEASVTEVLGDPGHMHVVLGTGDSAETIACERVLLATGRRPRIADLDPAAAGLAVDERGRLVTDPMGRTSDPRVWVAGDALGGPMHTPMANAMGRHVAEAMLGRTEEPLDLSTAPVAVFTFPELAHVGVTEEQARTAGVPCEVHRQSLANVGAAVIADEREGLVKIVSSSEDGRILGAQLACHAASDLVYPFAVAIRTRATLSDLRSTPAVHPAFSQAAEWAAW